VQLCGRNGANTIWGAPISATSGGQLATRGKEDAASPARQLRGTLLYAQLGAANTHAAPFETAERSVDPAAIVGLERRDDLDQRLGQR
jgi:hypothetical protein